MNPTPNSHPRKAGRARVWVLTAAAAVGVALGAAGIASAATDSSSSTAASSDSSASSTVAAAAPADPATVANGPGETLLTGTTAEKVTAAALAAVPDGTIIRVETDSAGSAYEAHMTKADGTQVTVKLDADFNVTATEAGFGAGGPGR